MSCQAIVAFMLTAFAAGCAELHWQKEVADAATHDRDLRECRQVARLRAYHEAWPFALTTLRMIGVDSLGRPIAPYVYRIETDRFLLEHDLTRACMRGKGYELVPAKKP